MLLKLLRNGLGNLVILISFFIPIKKIKRSDEDQKCVNDTTNEMSLYQFHACPFCLKTRRALKKLKIQVQVRDALKNPHRADLLAGGGKIKVPCLRIDSGDEITWMYESNDIINYLEQRFGEESTPCNKFNYQSSTD
ncbi:MAG: glutaredoxin [endosymbiont of Galathealinum brachiosum]|uniref:Glutaredoxin n=1 Tax=endosymbiont of Galathealinum brachiosum TaxID=2200906 RepID=A0A370DC36_9GAMM|nr:MAG: glutaredoxin [endosymbiont of Galathealinum brachiosum]